MEKIKKAGRALRKRICSVIEFPGKIQKKIRNFALTIRKFCDKIKRKEGTPGLVVKTDVFKYAPDEIAENR